MKIHVRNLGIIHEAEFDLKPLTIFIGPNNSGKTWLAYTLAGILGPYGYFLYTDGEQAENVAKSYPPLIEAVDKILEQGTAHINLVQFVEEYGEYYFKNVALQAREWLPKFMSTRLASFSELELSIDLTMSKNALAEHIRGASSRQEIGRDKQKAACRVRKKKGEAEMYIYTRYADEVEENLPREIIEGFVAESVLWLVHRSLYPNVTILPTERATLVTIPFINDSSPEQEGDEEADRQYEIPRSKNKAHIRPASGPVGNYIHSAIKAYAIGEQGKTERAATIKNIPQIKEYICLAQLLEQNILGGKVDFSKPEPGPEREIVFQPTNSAHALEISITSSMVKELSPLVFYLRYFAKPGDLLIIDEPEMNLHPQAQVQMIEFLAMLVNAGLHVLVTTHSPYMIDHLTNLTLAAEHEDKEVIRPEFYLQDASAFIHKDKVSVYLFDHGEIKDAMNNDEDSDTFGNVSDRISEIYFKL